MLWRAFAGRCARKTRHVFPEGLRNGLKAVVTEARCLVIIMLLVGGLRWGDWAEGWLREGDLEGGNGAMWGRVVRESAEMVN